MMKLKIIELPNPILRQVSKEVKQVDEDVKITLADMLETMYKANGAGLAAPQVGLLKRMVVIDAARKGEEPAPYKMVNPKIVWHSDELQECQEGCLSIPNQYAPVQRFESVKVEYLDENGKSCVLDAKGFLAVAIQHELDHLDGIIFIDHLSKLRQKMMFKKQEKRQKRLLLSESEDE
ncbi:MAG: peptide deformylase [Alphaproteobacteria bacterium]